MEITLAQLNDAGNGLFPGHIGVEIESVENGVVRGRMELGDRHLAPNGYLHAAAVIGLADTACGYGSILGLPEGGIGFTTISFSPAGFAMEQKCRVAAWRSRSPS